MDINRGKCTGCGMCVEACKNGAVSLNCVDGKVMVNVVACKECGECIKVCPNGCISFRNKK